MTWKDWTLIAATVGGVLRFLWISALDKTSLRDFFSRKAQQEVEKERIESNEEQVIYQRLSERVETLHTRVEKNRKEIDEWKEKYYEELDNNLELKRQNDELKAQNELLTTANEQLQRSVLVIRKILKKVLKRLSEHEDFEDIPDLPGLSITDIDDQLLQRIHDPNFDTPMTAVFEGFGNGHMPDDMDLETPSAGEPESD